MTVDEAVQLAVQHHQAGRLPEAEGLYRQVLAVMPNHSAVLHNLGQMAYTLRKFDLALPLLNKSLAAQPNDPNTHNTLAATLFAMGQVEGARDEARLAILFDPRMSPAYANLGNALVGLGEYSAGIEAFEKSIALDPNSAIAHDGYGATLLLLGDLQRGWREAEWRWHKPGYEIHRFANAPQWDGSDLAGKRLLLMVEQGYGDVFQFCRYAPLLKARGATVILEVVPDIHRLLSTVACIDQLVIAGLTPPPLDLVTPLLSVPYWFGTTLETIPAQTPYLTADARLIEDFAARFFSNDPNFKVGIVWAGRPTHSNDHHRSMTLATLGPVFQIPGVSFYSLQKGDASKQLHDLSVAQKIIDLSLYLHDFNLTAAAIAGLDLVITVDTAVSHLAGALNKPVWVMLPFVPDWRWMLNRDDSPWYSTMQLFRQKKRGDWQGVVQRVAEALEKKVGYFADENSI